LRQAYDYWQDQPDYYHQTFTPLDFSGNVPVEKIEIQRFLPNKQNFPEGRLLCRTIQAEVLILLQSPESFQFPFVIFDEIISAKQLDENS